MAGNTYGLFYVHGYEYILLEKVLAIKPHAAADYHTVRPKGIFTLGLDGSISKYV